jgi:hypothetical protein
MNERLQAILSNPLTELVSETEDKWEFYHPNVGSWTVRASAFEPEEEPEEEPNEE